MAGDLEYRGDLQLHRLVGNILFNCLTVHVLHAVDMHVRNLKLGTAICDLLPGTLNIEAISSSTDRWATFCLIV